jgi:hypothetical protein
MNKPATRPAPVAAEPVAGHNKPPLLPIETLLAEYAHVETAIVQLEALVKHEDTPVIVEDEADLGVITDLVKKARGADKRIEALRVERKAPYLEAERLVDTFFSKFASRVAQCKKTLEARGDRYLEKEEKRERQKREADAKAAREAAAKAAAEAEEKRREAVAAASKAAAEAARAENDERAKQAAKTAADNAQADLLVATQTADNAANAASSATAKAAAPAHELAKTHTDGGTASLKQNWVFEITNANIVDLNLLRPYLTIADIEKAIRKYIANGKHLVGGTTTVLVGETREGGIPGVRIFDDKKGTYR